MLVRFTAAALVMIAVFAHRERGLEAGGSPEPPALLFQKSYGGTGDETGNAIVETRDGGYLIAGYATVGGADHEYLVRVTASGDTLWTRTSTERGEDSAWDARRGADGSIGIVGFTTGHGSDDEDVLVTAMTDGGETRWRRALGGPGEQRAWGMTVLPNGDYAVAGQTRARKDLAWSGFIARVSPDGRVVWTRTLDRGVEARLFGAAATKDGGAVFVGTRRAPEGHRHAWVVSVDANGEVRSEKEFGGARSLIAHGIVRTADGSMLVTGYGDVVDGPRASTPTIAGPLREQAVLLALTERGDSLWTMRADGASDERTIASTQLVNGDFLSVGYRRIVGEIDWDILVSATSARGLSQWSMTFGGPAPDRGVAVIEARDGSLLVTGSVNNGAAHGNDVALIKLRRTR